MGDARAKQRRGRGNHGSSGQKATQLWLKPRKWVWAYRQGRRGEERSAIRSLVPGCGQSERLEAKILILKFGREEETEAITKPAAV